MILEEWVKELLDDIKDSALKGGNFDLHMESAYVKEVAEAWNDCKWLEIY